MINRLKIYWMILTGKHHVCRVFKMSFVQRVKKAFFLFKILGFKNLKPIKVSPAPDDLDTKEKRYTDSMPSHSVDAFRYGLGSINQL